MGKGDVTRQTIIERSAHLFSIKGYYNTSITDITEATQLTKGGLYGHFQSKEEIWYAVYDQAVQTWREIVFRDVRDIEDPLERIEAVLKNNLTHYLGDEVYAGGCFFLNMLVELSGQNRAMSGHILNGFIEFSKLINQWLKEADEKHLLRSDLQFTEIASFVVIAMNGCSALYAATRDPGLWKLTLTQLNYYINSLRR